MRLKGLNALLKHTHAHTPCRVTEQRLQVRLLVFVTFYCLKMTKLFYAYIYTVFSTAPDIT